MDNRLKLNDLVFLQLRARRVVRNYPPALIKPAQQQGEQTMGLVVFPFQLPGTKNQGRFVGQDGDVQIAEDQAAHRETEHFKRFLSECIPMLEDAPDGTKFFGRKLLDRIA